MNCKTFIYTLSDPDTGEVRYVGKTVNMETRFNDHVSRTSARNHKTNWIKELAVRGKKPIMEIIEEVESIEDVWIEAEKFWISYLRFLGFKLVNMGVGGLGSAKGVKFSQAHRNAISRARVGIKFAEQHLKNLRKPHKFSHRIDLTGKRFGKLTVIERVKTRYVDWKCRCDCGAETVVNSSSLRRGLTKSCGSNKCKVYRFYRYVNRVKAKTIRPGRLREKLLKSTL